MFINIVHLLNFQHNIIVRFKTYIIGGLIANKQTPTMEPFQIVEFKELRKHVKIIPHTWITYNKDKEMYYCRFPSLPESLIYSLVEDLSPPDEMWKGHYIEIRGQASEYLYELTNIIKNYMLPIYIKIVRNLQRSFAAKIRTISNI